MPWVNQTRVKRKCRTFLHVLISLRGFCTRQVKHLSRWPPLDDVRVGRDGETTTSASERRGSCSGVRYSEPKAGGESAATISSVFISRRSCKQIASTISNSRVASTWAGSVVRTLAKSIRHSGKSFRPFLPMARRYRALKERGSFTSAECAASTHSANLFH